MQHLYHVRALPTDRPIYIFGAGRGGECLFQALSAAGGYRIAGFIDLEKTGSLAGLPVVPTADFVRTAPRDCQVVLASQHWPEVASTLALFGFAHVRNAYPLICRRLGIADSTWVRRCRERLLAAGIAGVLAASYALVVLGFVLIRAPVGS